MNWATRAARYRREASDLRAIGKDWPDPDIATSFANAASELETVSDALLERHQRERRSR